MNHCPCVFPAPTEEEWITLPSNDPNTSIRMYVQTGQDGYVRLQQLAFDDGAGWYVQKSFIVPADMLSALATQFRKADCLMIKTPPQPNHSLRLVPAPVAELEDAPQRRRA